MKNMKKMLVITLSALMISSSAMAASPVYNTRASEQLTQCTIRANEIAGRVHNVLRTYSGLINDSLSARYNAPFKHPEVVKAVAPILALVKEQKAKCIGIKGDQVFYDFKLYGRGTYLLPNPPTTNNNSDGGGCHKVESCSVGDNGKVKCSIETKCTPQPWSQIK